MEDHKNKRRHPRVPVGVPGRVYLSGQPGITYPCHVLDVSLGGAFIHCTAPISLGHEVQVEIHFERNPLISAKVVRDTPESKLLGSAEKSVVRWARGSAETGFGIEFVQLPPAKKEFLEKLIEFLALQQDDTESKP